MAKNFGKWIALGLVALVIVVTLLAYHSGWRLTNDFALGKVGTVSMTLPFANTSVYIDAEQRIITATSSQAVTLSLSPRSHSVIVSHDGYFPWKKDFTVPSRGNVTLDPIFVTQNASGEIITKNDPDYYAIKNNVQKNNPPDKTAPLVSADGTTKIWLEDNAILAQNTNTPNGEITTVIQPGTIIKNLFFYKDRSDVVMFSTGNAVYVIETDKTGTQNFLPVYKGTDPYFIAGTADYIYVLDGDNLMQVII